VHKGRTTQVWDAAVEPAAGGKALAHFRCTQLILWLRAGA
jgi:acyl-coenzyme A thioesterase PaaI-like protein